MTENKGAATGEGDGGRKGQPPNVVASINQRLLNLARERHEEYQLVLMRYALERLLYRLGQSPHAGTFVVKGATLFSLWGGGAHRATRDLDLLGFGPPDTARLEDVFRDLCHIAGDDGLTFVADSVRCEPIRQDQEYGGIRVHLLVMLGKARIPVQVDVGFGDVVTPGPVSVTFPTLLDLPPPQLQAYTRETVVAEKFQALVALGMANTRLKDFYDLWVLARQLDFDGATLSRAIGATFVRRATSLPVDIPLALTATFAEDSTKQMQWRAFLRKSNGELGNITLAEVAALLAGFLLPPTQVLLAAEPFDLHWQGGGPWQ